MLSDLDHLGIRIAGLGLKDWARRKVSDARTSVVCTNALSSDYDTATPKVESGVGGG